MDSANPRGALWNRWDPHIHAPGTILSDQYKGSDPWEEFLSRIENSDPLIRALGITDYYSIAVYEQVLEKQRNGRLSGIGLILSNVEMRFGIETAKGSAINVHLLFSPEDPDHVALIKRFLSELHFPFQGETYRCDPGDLVRLGKAYDKSIKDDRKALEAGSTQFKVNFDELRKAWKESTWVQHSTLVAVAGGSTDGTSGLKENSSFTALRREIETFANIIFSSLCWLWEEKIMLANVSISRRSAVKELFSFSPDVPSVLPPATATKVLCWTQVLSFHALRSSSKLTLNWVDPASSAFLSSLI